MRFHLIIYIALLFTCASSVAVNFPLSANSEPQDSQFSCLSGNSQCDTLPRQPQWMRPDTVRKHRLKQIERRLNDIDTAYIEPQQFNFTVMLQNITTYEVYRLNSKSGQSITFSPDASIKVGPYFGWRWAFLGYTIDVKHMDLTHHDRTRKEYDLSLYSSKVGVDFYYRETGNDYKIRNAQLSSAIDADLLKRAPFGGLKSSIKGLNVYYIFNHRKFSYPAAFSQSTVQRRSAGSPLLGIGYTRHSLSVDWDALTSLLENRFGTELGSQAIDKSLMFENVKYTDVSVSGGYAYNYVFKRNWLLAASLSLAIAYKRSTGNLEEEKSFYFRDFSFNNINMDGIGRMALVYNNSRWYGGCSATMHAYNYHKSQFSTNNIFGAFYLYMGVNFGRKRADHHENTAR